MKKIVRILGSLELTLVLMLLVSLWFALGAVLAVSSQYGNTVRSLNDQLVWKSLFELPRSWDKIWSASFNWVQIQREIVAGFPSPDRTVKTWLWAAFALAFLLGINLLFGIRHWLADFFRRRLDFRRFLLLTVHVLFGVVLVGHLVSALWGVKAVGQIPVRVRERIELPERLALEVDGIEVLDAKDVTGREGERAWMTPDRYLRQPVRVHYTIYEQGRPVHRGQVGTFAPDAYRGLRVTLIPFSFRSQVSHDFVGKGVGPQIAVTRNPGVPIMAVFQPLWILCLLAYLLATPRFRTDR